MLRDFFHYFIWYICITGFVQAAYLRIYDDSINKFEEFDLETPQNILKAPGYDATSITVIYAFGFTGKAEGITVSTILGTYMKLGEYNAILLNWEKEASAPLLGPVFYPITVLTQVAAVGEKLGMALYKLVSSGLTLERTHLIGFSVGAHLMGYAGRELKKHNLTAPRITGLDPAGPMFDERVVKPLDSYSAKYVDVLHTNPGELGSDESIATIDFWFNCGSNVQPGCENPSPIDEAGCSHDRSWMYFCEALENTTSFEAISASSCSNWYTSNGTGYTVYVGEDTVDPMGDKENFYLSTNNIQPYGRGANGVYAKRGK